MLSALKSSARPKLVSGSGYGSPARAELAVAIAERKAAEDAIAALAAARETVKSEFYASFGLLDKAKADLEAAKLAAPAHILAKATGSAGEPPMSVAAARAALQDAEDYSAALRAADATFDEKEAEAASILKQARLRVREAAMGVVREAAPGKGLLEEVRRLQWEFISRGRLMSWLMREGILPDGGQNVQPGSEHYIATKTRQFVDALPVLMLPEAAHNSSNIATLHELYSGAAPWKEAIEALMQDPNAPLPGGDR